MENTITDKEIQQFIEKLETVEKGPSESLWDEVTEHFGDRALDSNGQVDEDLKRRVKASMRKQMGRVGGRIVVGVLKLGGIILAVLAMFCGIYLAFFG